MLHHPAPRAQQRHPAGLRQLLGFAHQGALADPRRSLDHHDPAHARRRSAQRPAELVELGLALQHGVSLVACGQTAPRDRRGLHVRSQARVVACAQRTPGRGARQPPAGSRPGKTYGGST